MGIDLGPVLAVLLVGFLLVVTGFAAFALRRRLLQRSGGTFDCSLRFDADASAPGSGWMLGMARYVGDSIEWYRVFSYSPYPKRTVTRGSIDVVGTRTPLAPESHSLLGGAVVVECQDSQGPLELGMTENALTGFLAWLESAPPGQHVNVA